MMMRAVLLGISAICFQFWLRASAVYVPLREYSGQAFFDGWDFYGFYDNTTWGNVTYLDRANAVQQNLAFINPSGNAIIKVDNTSTVADGPLVYRNSIRITSQDAYSVGSLIIIDAIHMPYGCSVWPSFWTLGAGKEWPGAGEIDIIEGINMMGTNQMALHALAGCAQAANPEQSGRTLEGDCSLDQGCVVAETKPNSFGRGFAEAGGGVYALQLDVSGIFIWFWSRPDVPESIRTATSTTDMDTTTWGLPSASYPAAGCNITEHFAPQQLILLITLCGSWAGIPSLYQSTCQTPTGSCYADNIIGPGSPTYDTAYFEIPYIRTYVAEAVPPPPPPPPSETPGPTSSAAESSPGASTPSSAPVREPSAPTTSWGTRVSVPWAVFPGCSAALLAARWALP